MRKAGDSPCALVNFVLRLRIRRNSPQIYKNSEIAENGNKSCHKPAIKSKIK